MKYKVAVTRPVIQTAVVEIEADDEEDAAFKALDVAHFLPHTAWSGEFDKQRYTHDVIGVLAESERTVEEPWEDAVEYLLLRADLDTGEGELQVPPWLEEQSSLFVADICRDWLIALELLSEEGVEGLEEWIEQLTVDATKIPPEVAAKLPWIWKQRKGRG